MRFVGFKFVGGNVAYGGDLAMAEFVGDRKYYTAINSPSLWKSKDAIRVKQAFNDTIYTISEQGLTPYLVLNWVSGTGMSSSNWM